MVNELEIKTYIERNEFEALGRIADWLAFDHHMTFEDVFEYFAHLGGDRDVIEAEFFGGHQAVNPAAPAGEAWS